MDANIIDQSCWEPANMRSSLSNIGVLVVDDDCCARRITMDTLMQLNYKVEGVKHPMQAISILRERRGQYDLILIDYHMPNMNGIELQQSIHEEFDLPVIITSKDENKYLMERSLECGAAFFFVKPLKPMDCKSLWQYAVARSSTRRSMTVPSNVGLPIGDPATENMWMANDRRLLQAPMNLNQTENGLKTKALQKNRTKDQPTAKKQKVIWDDKLHNRFTEAVKLLGGVEKASPKKIQELMNVQGLTRQNVASHLQKYRDFLKREADKEHQFINNVRNVLPRLDPLMFYTPSQPLSSLNSVINKGEYLDHLKPLKNQGCTPRVQQGLPQISSGTVSGMAHGSLHQQHCVQSLGKDLQNSNPTPMPRVVNHHDAALMMNNQELQNQSMQAISYPQTNPKPQDPNSWRHESSFANHSRTHGGTGVPGNAYSSTPSYGNPPMSRDIGDNTNGEKLIGANQQVPDNTFDRSLTGLTGNNQIREEGGGECQPSQINPTISSTNLCDNYFMTLLTHGDSPDKLVQLPNQGEEVTLPTTASINDPRNRIHLLVEDNANKDYEELMGQETSINMPATAKPARLHQTEQTIPANYIVFDDYVWADSLLSTPPPSP
ncbi:hypothetical protein SAY87_026602 [Trapa incisa]|uniref:Two-component response regulator n=1 Tax=Trapa incisa TaxID=236973 RepID=A0AAN7JMD1_9MYRT|nr:hypothetical protein SAY87_026602 [Trapa incisa]